MVRFLPIILLQLGLFLLINPLAFGNGVGIWMRVNEADWNEQTSAPYQAPETIRAHISRDDP